MCAFAPSLTLLVLRYSRGTSDALFRKRQLRSVRCWVILVFRVGMLLERQALESDKASETANFWVSFLPKQERKDLSYSETDIMSEDGTFKSL